MRCREATELMSLRLDNQLETEAGKRLDDHLESCETCSVLWSAMRRAEMLLAQAPMVEPEVGFTSRVMARLPEGRSSNSFWWLGVLCLIWGTVVAAMLFVGSVVAVSVLSGQWRLDIGELTKGLIGVSWCVEQIRAVVVGIWLTSKVVSRTLPPTVVIAASLIGLMSVLVWGVIVGRIRLVQSPVPAE